MGKMENAILENDMEYAFTRWLDCAPCWKSRWFDVCHTIYNSCKEWAKRFILDPLRKTIIKLARAISYKEHPAIEWVAPFQRKGTHVFYMVEFFDKEMNPVFNKVGTAVDVRSRIKQEMTSYEKFGVAHAKVMRCVPVDDDPMAIALESFFRQKYILRGVGEFVKNDRFTNCPFNYEEADKIILEKIAERA